MNRFPDFSTWHPIPEGTVIPARTPYVEIYTDGDIYLRATGVSNNKVVTLREPLAEVFTEQPIPHPESDTWERAERMYRTMWPSLDDAWEYQTQDTKAFWYTFAEKYIEKKDN